MPMPPTLTTRDGLREAIRFDLHDALEAALQRVALEDGDVWNGVQVVTKKDLDAAISLIFDATLPPPSETTAEVSTPATIVVTAECPRCFIPNEISMTVGPELRVSADGSELRLKAKAKAHTHVCGQLPLERGEPTADQAELDDILEEEGSVPWALGGPAEEQSSEGTGEPMEGIEVPADGTEVTLTLGECAFPGCTLAAEHPGAHNADQEPVCDWQGCTKHHGHRGRHTSPPTDADGDLLPA